MTVCTELHRLDLQGIDWVIVGGDVWPKILNSKSNLADLIAESMS